MKTTMIIIGLLLALGMAARCQDRPLKERIQYLFTLMHQDSMMDKMSVAMQAGMASPMKNVFKDSIYAKMGKGYGEKMDSITARSIARSKDYMKRLVHEDLVDIYANYFTSSDIEAFITFYSTPAGQKMLAQTPNITKDMMTVMYTKYLPGLQETMVKEMQAVPKEQQ